MGCFLASVMHPVRFGLTAPTHQFVRVAPNGYGWGREPSVDLSALPHADTAVLALESVGNEWPPLMDTDRSANPPPGGLPR